MPVLPQREKPPPPQYCDDAHVPQSMTPPHPSLLEPQSYPSSRQVIAAQALPVDASGPSASASCGAASSPTAVSPHAGDAAIKTTTQLAAAMETRIDGSQLNGTERPSKSTSLCCATSSLFPPWAFPIVGPEGRQPDEPIASKCRKNQPRDGRAAPTELRVTAGPWLRARARPGSRSLHSRSPQRSPRCWHTLRRGRIDWR